MLSTGIRSGLGFDKPTLANLIETGEKPYEYDVLVLGTNPGGTVCAKEAANFGKKTALVHWRIPTPGEEEGIDEDQQQMMKALEMNDQNLRERAYKLLEGANKSVLIPLIKFTKLSKAPLAELPNDPKPAKWCRKVRKSRIDFKNSICNMAREGLEFMHVTAVSNNILSDKKLTGKSKTVSWGRMVEQILDHIIIKNWNILTDFLMSKVNVFEGHPISVGEHSVKILTKTGEEKVITAEIIITALESRYSFPSDVAGSREYGINCNDFYRLSSSPGKTLIVGAGPLGLTCAGILASFSFPVVVVERFSILKGGDQEMKDIVLKDLERMGVKFMEKKSLHSVQKNKASTALVAEFVPAQPQTSHTRKKYSEEFDTVLFTTKEKSNLDKTGKIRFEIEFEKLSGKTFTAQMKHAVGNYIFLPDKGENIPATERIGKHIIEQLFGNEISLPNFTLIPKVVLTPLEYSYVGISEATAKRRLGEDCIEVFTGNIRTGDVVTDAAGYDEVCFVKIICEKKRNFIAGLHMVGRDAVKVMDAVLKPVEKIITKTNLHPSIRVLIRQREQGREKDGETSSVTNEEDLIS